jgi:tetratricopeptide (TPR) repeat protein
MRHFTALKIFCLVMLTVVFSIRSGYCYVDSLEAEAQKQAKSLASYTMGVVYDLQGFTDNAIKEFEKSAQLKDNYAAHLRLGADYARMGKLPEAINELQIVIKQDAENVQARYLLALIYSSQKDFDKAAVEYEAILTYFSKAQPENKEIYGYLGQLYYSQKQYDKAIKQFEIVLSLDPTNTYVIFLLGSLYLETNNKKQAVEYFLRCTKVDPQHDGCLNSLGYLYAEEGVKLDDAQKLIEQALTKDPENGAYLDSLGWVYYQKGEYEQALTILKKADKLMKDPVIYDHLGDVYRQLKQPEDAKKYWKLSLELLPDQKQIQEKLKLLE